VIEHIEEDEQVLSQIYNACRPGGGVVITVPQHPWLWSPLDDFGKHKRRYSNKELVGKMEGAGFDVVESASFMSLLLPFVLLSRLRYKMGSDVDPARELSLSGWVNRIFEGIMTFERMLFKKDLRFPAGSSLLCVGKKKRIP